MGPEAQSLPAHSVVLRNMFLLVSAGHGLTRIAVVDQANLPRYASHTWATLGIWGHIVQALGGSIDPANCPW